MWLDPVLVLALALAAGAWFATSPFPAALGVLGVLAVLVRRDRLALLGAACVALSVGALRAAAALEQFDGNREAAQAALGAPQRCAIHGEVDAQPTRSGERTLCAVRVERADCESGTVTPGTRVRLAGGPDALARGDRVAAVAQLAPLELLWNPGVSDPLPFAARRGVVLSGTALALDVESEGQGLLSAIDRLRARVRRRILATYAPAAQPMGRALVLGENDLDPDDAEAFRKSGLSHMLAVSGTHLVFAVVSLVRMLTALLARIEAVAAGRDVARLSAALGALIALIYADFAGGSGSAWRAAYMLSAGFAARALGRAQLVSRTLGASVLIGWCCDPLVAFDLSFLLSFAATAGLLLLGAPLAKPCERLKSRLSRALGVGIATTLSAMIPCAPLLALLGAELTLAGVFANVVAAPIGEAIALPLCLAHAVVSGWPALESGVGLVASGALLVVRAIAHESAAQRWLSMALPCPNAYQLALVAVLAAAVTCARGTPGWQRLWAIAAGLGLLLVEMATTLTSGPSERLEMTSLSVGQGDATLLEFPDGKRMLVDAGGAPSGGSDPGERVVVPALRARRWDHIDVVVLSHPHPDHFGGLLAVVRAFRIGEIWDSGQGLAEGAGPVYAELIREARRRAIPIRTPSDLCGRKHAFGAAAVAVLAPCPAHRRDRGANDNSIVLRVTWGKHAFLLTGDAEAEAETDLVGNRSSPLGADVLKVGHHGSRSSTGEAFVAAVSPTYAVLSLGARNRFGHPAPEVVARLQTNGARVLRTDRDGAVRFETDGRALVVHSMRLARDPLPAGSGALYAQWLAKRVLLRFGGAPGSL